MKEAACALLVLAVLAALFAAGVGLVIARLVDGAIR